MTLPLLITGAEEKTRKQQAFAVANESSSTFDTIILDTKLAKGIDDIRIISQALSRRPYNSKVQTFIILEAQNLTTEAQNAFLKNLEEATETVKIVLTCPTSEALLSTVTSRCQKIEIKGEDQSLKNPDKFQKIAQSSIYKRFELLNQTNLDEWEGFWRKIILEIGELENPSIAKKGSLHTVLRYVKLIARLKRLQKRRLNPKIINVVLALEMPKIDF